MSHNGLLRALFCFLVTFAPSSLGEGGGGGAAEAAAEAGAIPFPITLPGLGLRNAIAEKVIEPRVGRRMSIRRREQSRGAE